MKINWNYTQTTINSLGYGVKEIMEHKKKQETIEIIFTKGKLEIIPSEIDRINIYAHNMNIYYKNNETIFLNLKNITTIK